MAVAAPPRGAPDEQARGVDLELHPRERERDRLVLDDLATELLALLGVVKRVLIGGARDPQRLRTDRRPGGLERLHRRLGARLLALAYARQTLVELVLAPEHVARRNSAVIEEHVGGVRGAQAVL